jgi:hypothetical protein
MWIRILVTSVADPNPDPSDPYPMFLGLLDPDPFITKQK